jgi:hypothetical protein
MRDENPKFKMVWLLKTPPPSQYVLVGQVKGLIDKFKNNAW